MRCLHKIIHTGSSAVRYLHCFDSLSEYSDCILQFDTPVTAGPCWCLGSNHNSTRLAVSMGYVNTDVMPTGKSLYLLLFSLIIMLTFKCQQRGETTGAHGL